MHEARSSPPFWYDHLLFLGRFVRSPRTIGAIAPSSRWLARRMLSGLAFDADSRVAELGPGTGAVTAELAGRLPSGARAIAVDIDRGFVDRLNGRWQGVECVCDRAERLAALGEARGLLPFDHIVSGLPFASLPPATTELVLDAIHGTLREGGTFTTFQYVHAYRFGSAEAFRRAMTRRMGAAPSRWLVLGNVPPALVLRWRRAG
jgi:phosphatidylethanolamine/phosphatidyl-N-methylethanolamine N-methyltransferase